MDAPSPPEFAQDLVCDTARHVRVPVEAMAVRVADRLREIDHWHPLIKGEELAGTEVDDLWHDEDLQVAYRRALAEVHEEYLSHAARVLEVAADLEAEGEQSWIAKALRHRFAFDVSWEAQDRLGLLDRFELGDLCAACGATLGVERSDDEAEL